ncbi:hypothetical protein [Cellulosimicrobium sp. Marseille-Q4280]|uniref:hypothetical protein n=1 Tax=Cellulosimicrobium sp. Marseille-Q4280 TaxID=2937992 RepID=UPI00203FCD19|nr:hypothetical protein [Cellulosimicrobium sp. Marseille-Q4280]
MTAPAPDALETARAALRRAELRTGVQSVAQPVPDVEDRPRPLAALLDGGTLPAGAVSVVAGSTSLLLALAAMSQGSSDWVAFTGMPDLGLLAAADAGLDLDRVALVPQVRTEGATVVAALLDGFALVVVGDAVALTRAEQRRLLARARERGAALVTTTAWEQAAVRLEVAAHRWSGTDRGERYLRRCELDVARTTRGATDRWTLTLPTPGGALVDPVQGQARPARARRDTLRLVG